MDYTFQVIIRYPFEQDISFVVTEQGNDAWVARKSLVYLLSFLYPGADVFCWIIEY